MEDLLSVPQGSFKLKRLPLRPRELLRAWDSADEYLLNCLAEAGVSPVKPRVLIVNDHFGALAVALNEFKPVVMSDSYLSQAATRMNFTENGVNYSEAQFLSSLDPVSGAFDWVLIKAPKTLALLEYQLIQLKPHLLSDSKVIVAGMVKNLSVNVWRLLEKIIGSTNTSLARKKARLIFVTPDLTLTTAVNPYPVRYTLESVGYLISNHANVFSRDSLDIGTRFFLKNQPRWPNASDIVDLGCGNGVVGLIAASENSAATLHFVDESFMAIASARENFERVLSTERKATFRVGDCLTDFAHNSADIILCNPPFHQQNTVGDMIARQMFTQAKNVLRPDGELWVIGNRHLGYHLLLKKLFKTVERVASDAKFIILRASK